MVDFRLNFLKMAARSWAYWYDICIYINTYDKSNIGDFGI